MKSKAKTLLKDFIFAEKQEKSIKPQIENEKMSKPTSNSFLAENSKANMKKEFKTEERKEKTVKRRDINKMQQHIEEIVNLEHQMSKKRNKSSGKDKPDLNGRLEKKHQEKDRNVYKELFENMLPFFKDLLDRQKKDSFEYKENPFLKKSKGHSEIVIQENRHTENIIRKAKQSQKKKNNKSKSKNNKEKFSPDFQQESGPPKKALQDLINYSLYKKKSKPP